MWGRSDQLRKANVVDGMSYAGIVGVKYSVIDKAQYLIDLETKEDER